MSKQVANFLQKILPLSFLPFIPNGESWANLSR